MKRLFFILLCSLMVLSLMGCGSADTGTVSFYYCRDPEQYQYFESDSVIQAERRDLIGHQGDLKYMVGLYLAGPMEEGMAIPFSKSTKLLSVQQNCQSILIELSDHTNILTDSEFSLACAALAMTCMDFTDCEDVTISSGNRSITLQADDIILSDNLPQQETTGG